MQKKKKIMIVEDEELIALSLEIKLSKKGYDVCTIVNSGEDAIKSFSREKPDIVLLDIMLKGNLDGIETARAIQDICEVPIIFSTGYLDDETRERARDVEHAEYFVKPVLTEELIAAISNALED